MKNRFKLKFFRNLMKCETCSISNFYDTTQIKKSCNSSPLGNHKNYDVIIHFSGEKIRPKSKFLGQKCRLKLLRSKSFKLFEILAFS